MYYYFARRPIELEDVKAFTLDEALSDPSVDAVMISSEPKTHEEYVQ